MPVVVAGVRRGGVDVSAGLHRRSPRGRPDEPDRHGLRARWPALRLRAGRPLRVIKNGLLLPAPFVTLTVNAIGERGLLGVAFDPDFATNQLRLRLLHRHDAATSTTASAGSPPTATSRSPGSELVAPRPRHAVTAHQPQRRRASTSAPTASSTSPSATTPTQPTAQTLHEPSRQDPADQRRRHRSRPTTRSSTTATGVNRAIWALGLAQPVHVRGPAGDRAGCSSTTWARTPGRRSTTASPGPTTAGRRVKGPTASSPRSRATPASTARSTPTIVARPPSARSSAARSTTRRRSSIRRRSSTRTSSPTCVPGGSAGSIPPRESCRTSAPASRARSRSGCRATAASTI